MRKQKIYLETTLFNYYFDEERDAHADTVKLFEDVAAGKYEAYTSDYVVRELENTESEKRHKMLALIGQYSITLLALDQEAEQLANAYVEQGIIPGKYWMDGVHIAIATVNELDMIISMNFQHIVKRKTKLGTASINALNGYRAIEIYNPMEVHDEKTEYN
ncbi:MAG: hypothetical protein LBV40_02940 [Methanomicrobiales archaeon]|jgi:predicted nucleic acid-binding protein|nr:hypothetical protein [Methanomicrobiales archaeon]